MLMESLYIFFQYFTVNLEEQTPLKQKLFVVFIFMIFEITCSSVSFLTRVENYINILDITDTSLMRTTDR